MSLILIKSLGAHFQLLEVCTQDEVEKGFGVQRFGIIWFLNGLPKTTMANSFESI
jgi:hypothetical protein